MPTEAIDGIDNASLHFLGQWSRLVSTTNWEKGRIIHSWREALAAANAPASEYSDDAWSQHVGGVTGQHVGRLRRVYERFGGVREQYAGLYWSHFQAAIDWNDAEMWLEGAIQNRWSVAEMRRERWQAFGGQEAERPSDSDIVIAEIDEDAEAVHAPAAYTNTNGASATVFDGEASGPRYEGPDFGDEPDSTSPTDRTVFEEGQPGDSLPGPAAVAPFVDLPTLPADLTDAFESFKLAILRHKTAGWREVGSSDVLRSLDALMALVTAPA